MSGWVLLIAFLAMVVLGEPLFVLIGVLALLGFCYFIFDAFTLQNAANLFIEWFKLTESKDLLAIPLFTLAGTIMTYGGMSRRLINFARALLGWLPGGLGMACVVACALFAAISGSSSVTIIAIGGIIYPALKREGFGDKFSLGLVTTCGAIGTLIPPSLPLLVYGIVAGNAVTKGGPDISSLFIAGVAPSILAVIAICAFCGVMGLGRTHYEPFSPRYLGDRVATIGVRFIQALPGLLLIGILLGGIYSGTTLVFEASAIACIYAILVEVVIFREVSFKKMPKIVVETTVLVGSILIIFLAALSFTGFLTRKEVPQRAVEIMQFDGIQTTMVEVFDAEYAEHRGWLLGERVRGDENDYVILWLEKPEPFFGPLRRHLKVIAADPDDPSHLTTGRQSMVVNVAGAVRPEYEKTQPQYVVVEKPAKDRVTHEMFPEVVVPKQRIEQRREALVRDKIMFLLGVNLILLVVGCVMDIFSGILVIAPLVVPMAQAYGVDLVHLGIVFAMNLELGFATPPFGINLFIAQSYFKKPMFTIVASAVPYLLSLLGVLLIVTYWPTLSLYLVDHPPSVIIDGIAARWYVTAPIALVLGALAVLLAGKKPVDEGVLGTDRKAEAGSEA